MGVTLQEQGKFERAVEAYNTALNIKPDYDEAYNNMGNALQLQGKFEAAIEAYNKALAIKPDYAEAYRNMGVTHLEQGKFERAVEAYKTALNIKPDYAEAHRNISNLIKYKLNDPQISTVNELLQHPDLNISDRCHLLYTFAKMKEDVGDYEAAYKNYVNGGKLQQKILAYDKAEDQRLFARIKNTAPKLKEFVFSTFNEVTVHTPIFILGMPRSGTTLIEQIISCHSKVHGSGELPFANRYGSLIVNGTQAITSNALCYFRKSYLDELVKVSNGKQFVTDKMPNNFQYIGLILKALPEAKIIHVKREPAANCWSNFKHYFPSKGLGYSYNLQDTVKYFGMYQELMNFWDVLYADRIYHLDYERLTSEQITQTRKLIEHLDLDWEDACLLPQDNKRSVRTASQQQVRQKVYRGSSKVWRNFEPYLNGEFDKFGR
jgi:tetratricopeptide (TPR) repeat protein